MACKLNYFILVILVDILNRFRWVFCQLEILRYCLPPSVRRTLDELPESLDETYERVLEEIKKPNRDHARRLLQCLVVATRPLRVAELAEVLAVDFDDAEGIPRLNPNWRWEDEEQALLTSCSSLITFVDPYPIVHEYLIAHTDSMLDTDSIVTTYPMVDTDSIVTTYPIVDTDSILLTHPFFVT